MKYPKIETLYARDETSFKVDPTRIRRPEFAIPKTWWITEKIDGMNVRIHLHPTGLVSYGGRTDRAQMPAPLLTYLQANFSQEQIVAAFDPGTEVVLFGEGFGPGIQNGGKYGDTVRFTLFDVAIIGAQTWWLSQSDLTSVACKLQAEMVPAMGKYKSDESASLVERKSAYGDFLVEGIVARTEPLLLTQYGSRLMWKLKGKDIAQGVVDAASN